MAAKAYEAEERAMFDEVVQPAIDEGVVDWRGEVDGEERDRLMAGAYATLMLGAWPEPFGLVAIESMATGTPVIARRAGGVTETIEHGSTGYLVDDVNEAVLAVERIDALRRDRIAAYARGRFSADRMVALYEQAFDKLLAGHQAATAPIAVGPGRPAIRVSSAARAVAPRVADDVAAPVAAVADLTHARRNRALGRVDRDRGQLAISDGAKQPAS
jgi:hypothetical protein